MNSPTESDPRKMRDEQALINRMIKIDMDRRGVDLASENILRAMRGIREFLPSFFNNIFAESNLEILLSHLSQGATAEESELLNSHIKVLFRKIPIAFKSLAYGVDPKYYIGAENGEIRPLHMEAFSKDVPSSIASFIEFDLGGNAGFKALDNIMIAMRLSEMNTFMQDESLANTNTRMTHGIDSEGNVYTNSQIQEDDPLVQGFFNNLEVGNVGEDIIAFMNGVRDESENSEPINNPLEKLFITVRWDIVNNLPIDVILNINTGISSEIRYSFHIVKQPEEGKSLTNPTFPLIAEAMKKYTRFEEIEGFGIDGKPYQEIILTQVVPIGDKISRRSVKYKVIGKYNNNHLLIVNSSSWNSSTTSKN